VLWYFIKYLEKYHYTNIIPKGANMSAKVTKVSMAIQQWADAKGLKTKEAIRQFLGVPYSTLKDWMHGISAPRDPLIRAKLFQLTGDPIFSGILTKEKKQESLEPPSIIKTQAAILKRTSDKYQLAAQRANHLIAALLPDLVELMKGSTVVRMQLRALLGKKMEYFFIAVRALNSEKTYEVLREEGLIKKLIEDIHHAE